jgi:hypothetical protein
MKERDNLFQQQRYKNFYLTNKNFQDLSHPNLIKTIFTTMPR